MQDENTMCGRQPDLASDFTEGAKLMIPVLQTTFPHLDAPAVTQLAQDLAAEKYGQGMPKVDNGIPVIDGGLARCLHDLLRLEPVDAHHAAQTLGSCGIHDLRFNF